MGLAKYWINLEEFLDIFRDKLEPLILKEIEKKLTMFGNCEDLLREIEDLLPDNHFTYIIKEIGDLISHGYTGESHIDGIREDLPPIQGDHDVVWKSSALIALAGIQLETTGWKPDDCYSLRVVHYLKDAKGHVTNKATKNLFYKVPFKELGEHKFFDVFYNYYGKGLYRIKKEDEIIFTIHNNSGNSRQLYLDIEYLWLGKDAIASGSTAIFLDVSGSMWSILANMEEIMRRFLFNLGNNDKVTLCFVADRYGECKRGTYDFSRKDFSNKDAAISFISNVANIPNFPGGMYDIVTVQSAIDYKMSAFNNYVFCTDQSLEQHISPDTLKSQIQTFFKNKEVYTIPTSPGDKAYWQNVYSQMGLFKPLEL